MASKKLKELEASVSDFLQLDLPYEDRVHREFKATETQPAAVLLLLGDSPEGPSILYTRRTETVETHKGQIAFPGGMCEANENNDPDLTALRETEEEVGISSKDIRLVGRLPKLLTVTGFLVHPAVGFLKPSVEDVKLVLNSSEIAETLWVPLSQLQDPGVYRREYLQVGLTQYPIHVYQVGHWRIWGATASMTKNFLDRMDSLM